jgi:hypothetical protein
MKHSNSRINRRYRRRSNAGVVLDVTFRFEDAKRISLTASQWSDAYLPYMAIVFG